MGFLIVSKKCFRGTGVSLKYSKIIQILFRFLENIIWIIQRSKTGRFKTFWIPRVFTILDLPPQEFHCLYISLYMPNQRAVTVQREVCDDSIFEFQSFVLLYWLLLSYYEYIEACVGIKTSVFRNFIFKIPTWGVIETKW